MTYTYRCPDCRTRRKSFDLFTRHLRESGHRACNCGGYEWGPHRPGSPCCDQHPAAAVHRAARQGATYEECWEIQMALVTETPGRPMREWPASGDRTQGTRRA